MESYNKIRFNSILHETFLNSYIGGILFLAVKIDSYRYGNSSSYSTIKGYNYLNSTVFHPDKFFICY